MMLKLFDTDQLKEISDSALHYYALSVTYGWYVNYWLWEYLKPLFRPQFRLYSRAKAVVVYDQIINDECRVRDNLTHKT